MFPDLELLVGQFPTCHQQESTRRCNNRRLSPICRTSTTRWLVSAPLRFRFWYRACCTSVTSAGESVSAPTSARSTTLHLAVCGVCDAAVEALLANGAHFDARTSAVRTPPHFSCHRGHAHIAQRLQTSRADANAFHRDGRIPLFSASCEGSRHADAIMLDAGLDPND